MTKCLFIAQQTLSAWLEQERISFIDNVMTIKSDGRQFQLQEAVRFVKIEEGEDVPGLVGKVKTLDQLTAMEAERYCDSVIFQDAAYKVQEGFIGEVIQKDTAPILLEVRKPSKSPVSAQPPHVAKSAPPIEKVSNQDAKEVEDKTCESDEELLTRFLLKNL
jgi:hypothetical protein